MSTMIKAEHLTFRYPDEPADHPPVLDDINLEIAAGSFVAILGHNGSGKSTFAKHCNALLTPTQGKLWVDGLDTSDPDNLLAIRGTVGMVFQNPDNQIVASVVEEDVAFGPENMGIPPEEIRKRVDTALKMVGMYEWREHAPHLLSGGQKQRVAIAGMKSSALPSSSSPITWMRRPRPSASSLWQTATSSTTALPQRCFSMWTRCAMPAWPCRRRWAFCTNCARRG